MNNEKFKNPLFTGIEMVAQYADSIISFLRLKEKKIGPAPIYVDVIVDNVITMKGLTEEERLELTKTGKKESLESWHLNSSFLLLEFMELIQKEKGNYSYTGSWKLTTRGRELRFSHRHYIEEFKCLYNKI